MILIWGKERDLAESGRSSSCWAISTANTEKRRSNLNDVFSWTISNTRFGIRSHSTIKERRWSHLHLFSFSFGLSYDLTQLHTQRPKREMNGRTKWMWCNHAKINIPLLSTNIIIKNKVKLNVCHECLLWIFNALADWIVIVWGKLSKDSRKNQFKKAFVRCLMARASL